MFNIAVYGKGGIGKSTISSNISYSLSGKGLGVTQIGCDPKHDSTLTLLGGRKQPTVLDYVRDVSPMNRSLGDVVVKGVNGISCVEAGGPQPGIGCAGRGILTTFDVLDELGLREIPCDITVYDVLGDVVCGGFAVPMRKENTDAIFVVTSGEFMSMYAANNILRGMMNFDPATPRVAGIILNRRGMEDEYERVKKLADAVRVPIVADIPRAPEFKEAALRNMTVSEAFPDSEPARVFSAIADMVLELRAGERKLYSPRPLDDAQMDDFGKGKDVGVGSYDSRKKCCAEYGITSGMCASMGASHEAGRIKDIPVIIHGPRSCGHIMDQVVERHFLGAMQDNPSLERRRSHRFICTDMHDSSSIFGGQDNLTAALETCVDEGYRAATVITTCVTGMIGDDVDHIIGEFRERHPDFTVLKVEADGNHTGTSIEGREQVMDRFFTLIDTDLEPDRLAINLVDANFMNFDGGMNETWFRELIGEMGIPMGVKIIDECTLDEIRECKRNSINAMVADNENNMFIRRKVESLGFRLHPLPLPRGYSETVRWIRSMAETVGREDGYADIIDRMTNEYRRALDSMSYAFKGLTVDFMVYNSADLDWMIEALRDAGADVRRVDIVVSNQNRRGFYTRFRDSLEINDGGNYMDVINRINLDPPDLLISGRSHNEDIQARQASTKGECLTHRASIKYLDYVRNLLVSNGDPQWRNWRCFE